MCGIVGYISKAPSEDILKKMSEKIAHRGPDGEGVYVDEHVALGHRRLAIIDLESGKQPILNEDGNFVIIFNGEIYNFEDIKKDLLEKGHKFTTKTDTEVILHGYEEYKDKILDKLRGMYSFAIWDKKKKELFLARDKWGIKPLYYYQNGDTFMFASEIKAFLPHPDFKKEFNEEILSSYLCFNSTPTEETFFKGVFRVEPGHSLLYKNGKIKINKFFSLSFDEGKISSEEAPKKIDEAFKDSCAHHLIADVEVGSFLSSGIDSSYVVSTALVNKTYTVGYDDKRYDEISYAKDLSKRLGIENKSCKIDKDEYLKEFPTIQYYMDEPLADPAAIALYFVARLASKDLKVVMSGEGADELFGGYLNYADDNRHAFYNKVPFGIRRCVSKVASMLPEGRITNFLVRKGQRLSEHHIGMNRIFSDKEAISLCKNKKQLKTMDILKPFYEEYGTYSNLTQKQAVDYYYWLVRDYLHAVDRNTMMVGLEARTPFLDDEVYKVARCLSNKDKINNETTKVALRKAASKVIPNESYKKKKLGFPVPLREWMREEKLYNQIKTEFNSDIAEKYFDVKKINKLLEDHINGHDTYKKVWCIYTFLVWYKNFFVD